MGLPLPWVKHLKDKEKKEEFERIVRASTTALQRLYDLIEEMEADILKAETTLDDFSNTDWAFKQAYRNGQKSNIKQLKQLLEFINAKE